jgi:pimeloyl-ACP methyl ester carboxylesterase
VSETSHEPRVVASADGAEIAYDVCGAGDLALVFVHGWSGNRSHWDAQVDAFAPRHTVVRVDLAGHGESGVTRDRWTVAAFADDVVAVVDELELASVVLVGHSLGGSVVVGAARRLGERVVGVIGIDTWSSLDVRAPAADIEASVLLPDMRADFPAAGRRFALLMAGPTADAALSTRIADEVAAMTPEIAVAILDEAITQGPGDLEAGLRELGVPKSAISSETFRPKDPAVFASYAIEHVVIPGTGHYLMLEQPGAFNAALDVALGRSTRDVEA